ncbi:MAG: hypothetical protein AB7F75_10200 [Planctomycetota bacterium]
MKHTARLAFITLIAACAGSSEPTNWPELVTRVQANRGLDFRQKVEPQEKTPEEIRALTSDIDDNENRLCGEAFRLFGFLEPGQDFAKIVREGVSSEARAFYHWDSGALVVPDNMSHSEMIEVCSHEIVHALQDQHFSLGESFRLLKSAGNTDRLLALRALTEGEAVLIQHWSEHVGGGDPGSRIADQLKATPSIQSMPSVMRGPAVEFPYGIGPSMVRRLLVDTKGWAALERVYRHPTPTTEWVLHPEKMVTLGDLPKALDASSLPFAPTGWKLLKHDVLGEYQLRLLLEKYNDPATAEKAATGWGGDRWQLYADTSGRYCLAWKIVMDSAEDLNELKSALVRLTAPAGQEEVRVISEKRGGLFLFAGPRDACQALEQTWR